MKQIKLENSEVFATVDDEDFERVSSLLWRLVGGTKHLLGCVMNVTSVKKEGQWITIAFSLGSFIMGNPGGKFDHKNTDPLDNRKENLRPITHQQNAFNSGKRIDGDSQYKGVGWHKHRRKWRARISKDGKTKDLGYFNDEIEAAKAYDNAAKELFGEYAYLNF